MIKPFFQGLQPTLNIAHRGGAWLYPENTVYAVHQAIKEHGCTMIETDVRLTADGEVVLFHDVRLDRTTNGEGAVNEWSWPDLQRLDAAYHFRPYRVGQYPRRGHGDTIPRLRDVLTEFPTMKFNIDLKVRDPRLVNAVSEIITSTHSETRVCLGSEYDEIALLLAKTLPNVALFYPIEALMECMAALMAGEDPPSTPYRVLNIPMRYKGLELISPNMLKRVKQFGLWVNVWTIDDESDMQRLVEMGVGGIMTDRPDRLSQVLAKVA